MVFFGSFSGLRRDHVGFGNPSPIVEKPKLDEPCIGVYV